MFKFFRNKKHRDESKEKVQNYETNNTENKTDNNTENINSEDERAIALLEITIKQILEDGGKFNEQTLSNIINGLLSAPLFLGVKINEGQTSEKQLNVMLLKISDIKIAPVFTRAEHAQNVGIPFNIKLLRPEILIPVLDDLGEHIIINPYSADEYVLDIKLLREVIVPKFFERQKAIAAMERYNAEKDMLGMMVCDYIAECNPEVKIEKIITIMAHLQNRSVWVPFQMKYSERDLEKFLNGKKGDIIQTEDNIRMKPDLLKNDFGKLFFPVFSTKEEAPDEYRGNFSWVCMPFAQCCEITKNHPDCNDIIINAFSISLPVTPELIDIVLSHRKSTQTTEEKEDESYGQNCLITNEQLKLAEDDANGGKSFSLDTQKLFFLTVFFEKNNVLRYSIDVEKANDSHYQIKPAEAEKLAAILKEKYSKETFLENLSEYFKENGEAGFVGLLEKNGIVFQQFHFDEY